MLLIFKILGCSIILKESPRKSVIQRRWRSKCAIIFRNFFLSEVKNTLKGLFVELKASSLNQISIIEIMKSEVTSLLELDSVQLRYLNPLPIS